MIVIINWKISREDDGSNTITSWVPESDHKKYQLNNNIKKFASGKSNTSPSKFKYLETYYEYVFRSVKIKNASRNMWRFDQGSEIICFSFESRVQNKNYEIQSMEEILDLISF